MSKFVRGRIPRTPPRPPTVDDPPDVRPRPHPAWNYHERVADARGVMSAWKRQQPVALQAKFDRVLDQLRQMPKSQWHKPAPASALGNHIYVIRFTDVTKKQIRLFGHFFDAHQAFVMTFDGYEKDNVYYPAHYQALGSAYKQRCDADFQSCTQQLDQRCQICIDARPVSDQRH